MRAWHQESRHSEKSEPLYSKEAKSLALVQSIYLAEWKITDPVEEVMHFLLKAKQLNSNNDP